MCLSLCPSTKEAVGAETKFLQCIHISTESHLLVMSVKFKTVDQIQNSLEKKTTSSYDSKKLNQIVSQTEQILGIC